MASPFAKSSFCIRPLPFIVTYTTSRLPQHAQQIFHLPLSTACVSSLHATKPLTSTDLTHQLLLTHPKQDRVIKVMEQLI